MKSLRFALLLSLMGTSLGFTADSQKPVSLSPEELELIESYRSEPHAFAPIIARNRAMKKEREEELKLGPKDALDVSIAAGVLVMGPNEVEIASSQFRIKRGAKRFVPIMSKDRRKMIRFLASFDEKGFSFNHTGPGMNGQESQSPFVLVEKQTWANGENVTYDSPADADKVARVKGLQIKVKYFTRPQEGQGEVPTPNKLTAAANATLRQ